MADWYDKDRVSQSGSVILKRWNEQRQMEKSISRRVTQQRNFVAGTPSRTTGNWVATNTSIDQDLRIALQTLRARSRNLAQNNPYAAKFLKMVSTNVVGHTGFTLQSQITDPSGKADDLANDAIEAAFEDWSRRGTCEVTGQMSFADVCRLVIKTVACDGEAIIRRVRGKGLNKYGYALQLLDMDRLLVMQNAVAPSGNLIRMGVELDTYGKPVAYWLLKSHPGESIGTATMALYERVDAEDIFHIYIPLRPEQRRGAPWMAPVLESMYHLGEFDQSALMAARKGADTLGFFVSPDGEAPPSSSDLTDESGAPIEVSMPGSYDTLPEGYDFRPNTSNYPNDVYDKFVKAALRRVASGLGVAFHALGNDLTEVSFSSIRSGTLEERDSWMEIQDWMIEAFLTPVFLDWLQMSLGLGAITQKGGSALPVTKFDKFSQHNFQGRRWGWVDPQADLEAAVLAVNNGFKSRTQIISEQGLDRDTVWRQLAAEQKQMESMGLKIAPPPSPAGSNPSNNPPGKPAA
jgi:lambda family phage portal protein